MSRIPGVVVKMGVMLVLLFLAACHGDGSKEAALAMYDRGTIHISCDESFKPVIDKEVQVYESGFENAHIVVHYKPEAECLQDMLVDSVSMVIATRGFSQSERQLIVDSLGVVPEQRVIARDLIAVIVHPSSIDTFFNMSEIKDLLTGKAKKNLIPVFDGKKATSTVRFMLDSVLKGDSLSANVVAASNSQEVIDYVSRNPRAVGFLGYSWIGNSDDTSQLSSRKKIKIARLESTDSAGAYVLPSQYFIYTGSFPMVRDLVYVLKERHMGLAHAFSRFLEGDRGQLIFRRAYLMPVVNTKYIRNVKLSEKINNQ